MEDKPTLGRVSSPLLVELKQVIAELSNFEDSKKDSDIHIQTKYQRTLARLCFSIESILEHGRKDISLFGTSFFWNYVENLDKCLPGPEIKDTIRKIKESNKGNIGRGRLFIRVTLNEGTLAEYLKALVWNVPLTDSFYRETALLRDEDQLTNFLSLIDILASMKFNFVLKDKNLDDPDYWLKLTRKSSMASNSGTLVAPPNFVQTWGKANATYGDVEAVNTLVENVESKDRELQEFKQLVVHLKQSCEELKQQADIERKQKEEAELKYTKLEKDFQSLLTRLNDVGIELNVYKTQLSRAPSTSSLTELMASASVENINNSTNNLTSSDNQLNDSVVNESLNTSYNGTQELEEEILVEEIDEAKIALQLELFKRARNCLDQMKNFDESIKEKLHKIT